MKPVVIDNFLDEQSFQNLQNIMFGENFCWVYNGAIDYEDDEDKFQFTHSFYKNNIGPSSQQYGKLSHILNKIKPKEIYRIKANLLTRTQKIIPNTFHTDIGKNELIDALKKASLQVPDSRELWRTKISSIETISYTTAIFYINSNDGYTEFEDGTKVESVANRWVSFPEEMKHRGTSCTDERVRVVINFNYLT